MKIIPRYLFRLTIFFILIVSCSEIASKAPVSVATFDVNFVVMTQKQGAENMTTIAQLQKEIDILNNYFVGSNGERPIKFKFKTKHTVRELNDSSCNELLQMGDAPVEYNSEYWSKMINSCSDNRVVDPHAINFFIYDSYTNQDGFKDNTSHGRRNGNRPYVILDWERLNHQIQSPEEHEMGHAFGLDHVCVEGATLSTSTNIMASSECGKGSGGMRNIGFDFNQLKTIQNTAREIQKNFYN